MNKLNEDEIKDQMCAEAIGNDSGNISKKMKNSYYIEFHFESFHQEKAKMGYFRVIVITKRGLESRTNKIKNIFHDFENDNDHYHI